MKPRAMFTAVVLTVLLALPQFADAAPVHTFDCKNCHKPVLTVTELGGGNVCLECHDNEDPSFMLSDGTTGTITSAFGALDASNALGHNPYLVAGKGQTSHNWAAADAQPLAGATAPSRTTYPQFYSRQGASHYRVTCSRCHNPHADDTNPQLLTLGVGSGNTMCIACHTTWNKGSGMSNISHPVDVNYAAAAAANPGKYQPAPPANDNDINTDTPVSLSSDGKVVCASCHQAHFADSNPATSDVPAEWDNLSFSGGNGKLLRTYGRVSGDAVKTSDLCQTCHVFETHGGTHTTLGCLDCHGGHSPSGNYYILRPEVTGIAWVPKDGGAGDSDALGYTTTTADWMNAGGTGYCQGCHTIPVDGTGKHNGLATGDSAACATCHNHSTPGGSFTGSCNSCHGYAPSTSDATRATSYAVDGAITYLGNTWYKNEATTAHIDHADNLSIGAGNYKFQCNACHNDFANSHKDGNFQNVVFDATANIGMTAGYDKTGNGTCSTVYCHSNGGKRNGVANDGSRNSFVAATVPAWQGGRDAITGCTSCHNVPGANATAAHVIHISKGYACNVCHSQTATDSTTLVELGGDHVDGQADVDFDNGFSLGTAVLGVGSYSNTLGTCSVYCHSNGKGAAAQTADWDDATTGDCGDCHGARATDASVIASGSHTKHLDAGLTCDVCHPSADGSHASHLDGTIDKAGQAVCNACHGATAGQTTGNDREPVWTNSASVDCATCHVGVQAVINARTAPAKSSFYVIGGGHGDPTLMAGSPNCAGCHTLTADHLDGVTDSNMLTGGATADDAFCQSCHTTAQSHYANTRTSGGTSTDGTSCALCHEAHGDGMGTNTDVMLIVGSGFTDKTARASYWNAGNTGVCQGCHDPAEVNNFNRTGNADATHFPGQLCTSCHKHTDNPSFQANANSCGDCHNALMATKPHVSHVNKLNAASIEADLSDCLTCHDGVDQYTLTGSVNGLHRNGSTNVAAALTYNSSNKTCTNSCHSSTVADGSWNDTANWLDCTACHGNPPANGGGNGTAHADHISAGANCADCHVSVPTDRTHIDVTAGATDTLVLQNMAQAQADEATVVAGTWNDGNNTCNNLYCHSNGQASPSYALADWDTTVSSCVICHGGAGVTTTLTASHLAHIGTDPTDVNKQFGYTCDDCHVATASNNSTIISTANHTNTLRDVAVAVANGGTGTIGGDFAGGKCATTLCHGASTPTWATGATNGNCSACHGMAASTADGRDTNGDTVNTDTQVGAHVAHLTSAKNWSVDIACAQCHKTTVTNINAAGTYVAKVNAAGHIDSTTPAELVFDTLAGATATWNGATCATSYCHDGSKIGNGWSGTLNVPDWNTPFFNGTASHDCAFCHGYPPNPANGHPNDTDCSACHLNTAGTDDGFVDVTKHLNGIVETEGGDNCLDCHGTGKYKDPEASNPNHKDHTNVGTVLSGKTLSASDFGNVAYWYGISYDGSNNAVVGCGQCHPDAVALHRNGSVDTKLTPTGEAGIPAVNPKNNNTAGATFNGTNCSGVYCHGDGVNDGSYADSPAWDGTAGAAGMVCSVCHAATPATGKHAKHVGNADFVPAGCANCHTAANVSTHIGGSISVAAQLTTVDSGNQTCTNACHLSGNGDWDAAGTLACADCHGSGKDTTGFTGGLQLDRGFPPNTVGVSAAHGVHVANTAYVAANCVDCHNNNTVTHSAIEGTVTAPTNKVTSYTAASGTCANTCHGGATVDFRDSSPAPVCTDCHSGSFIGGSPTTGLHATNNALRHDDSFSYGASPTYTCTSCHNAVPSTNHIEGGAAQNPTQTTYTFTTSIDSYNRAVGCAAKCHDDNQATAGDAGKWLRKWIGVTDARPSAANNPGDAVCDNCHGDGLTGAVVDNSWNSGLIPGHGDVDGNNGIEMISQHSQCKTCHGWGDGGYNATWGASHGNGTLSMNGPVGTGSGYDDGTVVNAASNFGCTAACHSGSLTNAGDANFNHKLADSGWTLAYGNFGSGDCNSCHNSLGRDHSGATTESGDTHNMHSGSTLMTGCTQCHPHDGITVSPGTGIHNDGSVNFNNTKMPNSYDYSGSDFGGNCSSNTCHDTDDAVEEWRNVSLGADACDDCHNSGKTGVFSGLSAYPPTSNKHGLHLANSTLVATCSECHGHNGTLSAVSPFTNHIDGSLAVGDQLSDYTNPTCTNSCHDLAGNGSGAATWLTANANPLGCNDCHNKAANTIAAPIHAGLSNTTGPATGKHGAHVGASASYLGAESCVTCHQHKGELANSGTLGHANGAVSFDTAVTDYVTGNQTCTNVCHVVVDGRDWAIGASLACDDCHGAIGKSLYRSRTGGSHATHYVTGSAPTLADYGRTGNDSTTSYNFGCGECHPASEATDHLDGSSREVIAGAVYSGGATGTCGTNACHQNGNGAAPNATPTWGTPFTGDLCAKCHGNSPSSNAHGIHAVGIHFDGIYSGTTGLLTTATATRSHGNAATSTTISCSTCHNNVMTATSNAKNGVCASCHTDSATPATGNAAAVIANKQLHVNGAKNVVFASLASFRSKAQVRDDLTTVASLDSSWTRSGAYKAAASFDQAKNAAPGWDNGAKSCSTVDCHNGRPATWTDSNVSCNYCHTSVPQ